MTEPQPHPGQPHQLAIALADTPDGQRLAILAASGPVNVTLLLTAAFTPAAPVAPATADAPAA